MGKGLIHAEKDTGGRKLEPGKWREERLMVAPWKMIVFACPRCGMRGPVREESKETWEYRCLDNRCKFQDFVTLDGYGPEAGLEKPGEAEQSVG